MTSGEQREIAIWGGGAFAVVVVIAVWLWINGDADRNGKRQAERYHKDYESMYLSTDANRLPEAKAKQVLDGLYKAQEQEVQEAVAVAVFPGERGPGIPPEIANSDFMRPEHFSSHVDYDTCRDIISRVNERLNAKAKSMGISMRNRLPFESGAGVDTIDEAKRSLDMAKVVCYAMLVDRLLDAGVQEINTVSIKAKRAAWTDPTAAFATVTAVVEVVCNYGAADLILQDLANDRNGLGVQEVTLKHQDSKDFLFRLTGSLTVPNRPDWNLKALAGVDLNKTAADASVSTALTIGGAEEAAHGGGNPR